MESNSNMSWQWSCNSSELVIHHLALFVSSLADYLLKNLRKNQNCPTLLHLLPSGGGSIVIVCKEISPRVRAFLGFFLNAHHFLPEISYDNESVTVIVE